MQAALEARAVVLSAQVDAAKCELAQQTQALNACTEKNSALQNIADCKLALDIRFVEVLSTLNQVENELLSAKDKLHFLEDTVNANNECIRRRDARISELEESCRDLKSTVQDLEHQLRRAEQESADQCSGQKALASILAEAKEELCVAEAQKRAAASARDDALNRLHSSDAELTANAAEKSKLDALLVASEAARVLLSQQLDSVLNEVSALTSVAGYVQDLEAQAELDTGRLKTLQLEKDSLCGTVVEMDKLKNDFDQKILEFSKEREFARKKITELEQREHVGLS